VLLKIVYMLTCRILGLAVLMFAGTRRRMLSCWCSGTKTWCCAATRAGCGPNRPTGFGSPRWHGSFPAGAGPGSSGDTRPLLAWHRNPAAKTYDMSKRRKSGRPPTVP
jgi:hypothetical protein